MRTSYLLALATLAVARGTELPPGDFSSLLSAASMQQPISKKETFDRLRTIVDGPRHHGAPDEAERTFGPVVLGMPIPDSQKAHLIQLLQNRFSTVTEIRKTKFNEPRTVSDPKEYQASLNDALRKGTDPIDAEIASAVGPALAAFVARLIDVEFQLSQLSIRNPYDAREALGEPLSPLQRFNLAVALHHLDESRGRWIRENYNGSSQPHEPIDDTQLTKSEQAALAEMAANGLSPTQIESMRRGFIFTERSIHGIPIEYDHDCDLPPNAERLIAKACGEDGPQFGHVSVTMRGVAKAKRLRSFPAEKADDREFCAVVFESTPWSKSGSPYLMSSTGVALFYNGEVVKIVGENSVIWTNGHPPVAKL